MAACTTGARHKRAKNSLDVARDSFALLVTGPRPLSVNGRRYPGLPPRHLPLDEVRDLLLAGTCPQSTTDAVWAHLVAQARSGDPKWILGAVGAALPALISVAARLTIACPGDPADVQAEVLRGFLDALRRIDTDRPRIVLRLRWAAYRAGHAELVRTFAAAKQRASATPSAAISNHPDFLLTQAVAEGALAQLTADLIGKTRLESVSVSEWAALHGVSEWAAYKARRRAELRLAEYLRLRMTDADDEMTEHVAAVLAVKAAQRARDAVSKRDPDPRLQGCKGFPRETTSPEVRPCA
nr:hypothetical protein [Kibdelosporangium sp. MJ126-NF4]